MTEAPSERRTHPRYPLATGVEFYHGPSQRQFPGRCSNISLGGLKMYVPAATPVRPGQPIRLSIGAVRRPEFSRLGAGPVEATIVRVDRQAMIDEGDLAVGVRFAQA
ncbi:MAG TPA: PilZ domain-containing protein [Phycisphaerae bacterium]|nr:PilZ domain-containing protein [Phycisphaerae bacterium]